MTSQKITKTTVGSLNIKANKLTEWKFRVPEADGYKTITVDVHLIENKAGELTMRASAECMPNLEDANIDNLKRMVESTLKHSQVSSIAWEDWLEVKVTGYGSDKVDKDWLSVNTDIGSIKKESLSIDVRHVKYGLHPETGEPYIVYSNGYPGPVKKRPTRFQGEEIYFGSEEQTSYIPATAENIAAMDDVRRRMQMLRDNLSKVLHQDNVQVTLNNLAVHLPLLTNKDFTGENDF